MLRRALSLLAFVAVLLAAADARAERRVALVVGNAHYAHASPLRNPVNDARDMAALLRTLGFEVMEATDLDQRAFAAEIDRFGRRLEGADVGLFFYAGHGLQVNDRNYLVSVGARLENEFLIPAETVELDAVIRLMESRSRVNLVFLDACRNNPLADRLRQQLAAANRSVALGRGLARVEPTGRDTLIAFAAAPGQEAADGRGRNSPFTAALLRHLPKPGLEVSVMLKEVTAQVRQDTHNAQRPQQLSDMSRTFYFAGAAPAAAPPSPPAAPAPDHSVEVAYWNAARSGDDCDSLRAYLERYPNGIFADLARISERRLCDPTRKIVVKDTEPPRQPSAAPPAVPAPSPPSSGETTIAALPTPAEPAGGAAAPEIARALQHELTRVGCAAGKADGIWGARSRDALRAFNRHAQASLATDAPTEEALAAVQRHRGRACPPERLPAGAEPARSRDRAPPVSQRIAPAKDWRSISPLCQSAWPMPGGRMCCTYEPPGAAPRIICP